MLVVNYSNSPSACTLGLFLVLFLIIAPLLVCLAVAACLPASGVLSCFLCLGFMPSQASDSSDGSFSFQLPRAGAGWTASTSCWHSESASTAPELTLDGRLPLPAGIPLPPPPGWRWMGGFRFLLAFHFHRPRAGAGWAASASCWHERANQWPP